MGAQAVSFTVEARTPACPNGFCEAWMSSKGHGTVTGGEAEVDARVRGKFTAWDGYISGKNVELSPGKKIVQTWRTTGFTRAQADSRIEIALRKSGKGTRLTLVHSKVPSDQAEDYRQRWE